MRVLFKYPRNWRLFHMCVHLVCNPLKLSILQRVTRDSFSSTADSNSFNAFRPPNMSRDNFPQLYDLNREGVSRLTSFYGGE